jgi:hypothetical protein
MPGLGFSNIAGAQGGRVDPIQNQQDVHSQAMQQAAAETIQALQDAANKGATPQQLDAMIQSIPPEIQGMVVQMLQAQGGDNMAPPPSQQQAPILDANATTQQIPVPPASPQERMPQSPRNPITEFAKQLALEQDQQQQPLPPQQQMY